MRRHAPRAAPFFHDHEDHLQDDRVDHPQSDGVAQRARGQARQPEPTRGIQPQRVRSANQRGEEHGPIFGCRFGERAERQDEKAPENGQGDSNI